MSESIWPNEEEVFAKDPLGFVRGEKVQRMAEDLAAVSDWKVEEAAEALEDAARQSLLVRLEEWFHRLGSDDPKWWAKEIHAYLVNGDPLAPSDGGEDRP